MTSPDPRIEAAAEVSFRYSQDHFAVAMPLMVAHVQRKHRLIAEAMLAAVDAVDPARARLQAVTDLCDQAESEQYEHNKSWWVAADFPAMLSVDVVRAAVRGTTTGEPNG